MNIKKLIEKGKIKELTTALDHNKFKEEIKVIKELYEKRDSILKSNKNLSKEEYINEQNILFGNDNMSGVIMKILNKL